MRLPAIALLLLIATVCQAQTPDAAETARNIELLARYYDHGKRREHEQQAAFWSKDAMNNGRTVRPEAIRTFLEDIYRTFPDFKSEVLEMRAFGDTVIALSRVSGTHRGVARTSILGGLLQGAKPTGQSFDIVATHWWKFRDGKIVWHQATRDDLGMYRQLGLLPDKLPTDRLATAAHD